MKTLIKLVLALLCLLLEMMSYGQTGTIKGNIADEFGPLAGASVRLMKSEEHEIRGVISDFDGNFNLLAELNEDCFLEIRYMGYETINLPNIRLAKDQRELHLDTIIMKPLAEGLGEISFTVKKKEISFEDGKTTVQIADNPLAQGESAFSLLHRLPGISLSQNGDILLNGKSGVKVMVNNQLVYMSGEDLKSYLESLPSDAIRNIELSGRPSASMDAEGSAGVLNINLRKSDSKQFAGSVSAGYQYQDHHLWNGNVFLNKQYDKFDWSIIADASQKGNIRNQELNTFYGATSSLDWQKQHSKEDNLRLPLFLQLDSNYEISENQKTGVNVQLGDKRSDKTWNSSSLVKSKLNEYQSIKSFNSGEEIFQYGLLSTYYQINTDSLGSNLRISADGSMVNRELENLFRNEYDMEKAGGGFVKAFKTPSKNDYSILAGKADYAHFFQNGDGIKAGTKYSKIKFNSALHHYDVIDGVAYEDEEQGNIFNYTENIWAIYGEYSATLHPKWKLEAGLRIEKTWGEGVERLLAANHKKDYTDWFPTITVRQDVTENYQVEYSYAKRILRPQYEFLNPQTFHIDPHNYIIGNPSLKPQKSHSFSVTNLFKRKYQLGITYNYEQDFIGEVPRTIVETNQTEFSMRNLEKATDIGINAFVPIQIHKIWSMNNSLTVNYQTYSLNLEQNNHRTNSSTYWLLQSQQQVKLPEEFLVGVNVMVRSPLIYGYYNIGSMWGSDVVLQKSFLNNTWNVNLKVTDVFKSMKMSLDYAFNGNSNIMNQYMGNRSVSFQVKYRFGNTGKVKTLPATDLEEFERINK